MGADVVSKAIAAQFREEICGQIWENMVKFVDRNHKICGAVQTSTYQMVSRRLKHKF